MLLTPPSPYHGDLWAGQKVGILGGSFNPAHDGHRHISLQALAHLQLDAVWWMVSPQNPLKSKKDMAPLKERLASAEAVSQHPKIVVTEIEAHLNTRYTADTLEKLRTLFSRTTFVWLMGRDNLHQIDKWERWEEIFENVHVCVMDRPPRHDALTGCVALDRFRPYLLEQERAKYLTRTPLPAWTILHTPLNHLSATAIREERLRKTLKKAKVKA